MFLICYLERFYVRSNVGEAMPGLDIKRIAPEEHMQDRGWWGSLLQGIVKSGLKIYIWRKDRQTNET